MTQLVEILLDRDSVCAGDDISPHERTIHVTPEQCLLELLVELKKSYLATISGGQATWSVHLKRPTAFKDEHGRAVIHYEDSIAIVAQQWGKPVLLPQAKVKDAKINAISKLFFAYHAQIDPWFAYKQLSEYQFFDALDRLQAVPVGRQELADR